MLRVYVMTEGFLQLRRSLSGLGDRLSETTKPPSATGAGSLFHGFPRQRKV